MTRAAHTPLWSSLSCHPLAETPEHTSLRTCVCVCVCVCVRAPVSHSPSSVCTCAWNITACSTSIFSMMVRPCTDAHTYTRVHATAQYLHKFPEQRVEWVRSARAVVWIGHVCVCVCVCVCVQIRTHLCLCHPLLNSSGRAPVPELVQAW